ncbi:hypothetical protein [Ferribacterium limneticum]|uniref:hypothetical protein n=1 Tax=Ferribacterium limneticum TaxID=76259 RepID=UPI001CFC02D3|nr:hypothetical protein [Ferribacterium limneticum]UCV28985.1 hypothetical protein KI617_02470 [Ferribacterium limneticum]UCV32903.1 hypothetical protein KI608_02470 [Ferribacterium limneticum]
MDTKTDHFRQLTAAWLALVALTLASLGLSEWFRDISLLPLLVAAIIWIKGALVARCFIESQVAHPFIKRVLKVFIAISPLALLATAFYGSTLARWATL